MPRYLIAFALLLITAIRPTAQVQPSDAAALADAATVVLTGRVASVGVRNEGGAIYTYATLTVSEVLKGDLQDDTVVVKQLGGTLPDLGLFIAGQATFTPGEAVLVFLGVRPRDGTLYVVGLSRGKWQLLPDMLSGGTVGINGTERLVLDSAFRSDVSGSRPQADAFRTRPPEAQAASDFTFIPGSEGGPARWHEVDDGARIPIDYQTIPGNLPGGGSAQLDAAIGAWNGVNTRLELERASTGGAVCPARNFTGNGRIALYWDDPCGEVGDGDSATFGVGGGYFTPGSQKTINGVTFNKFLQGLAILNNTGPHLSTAACLQDAVTHVLGHAVGFGHSSDSNAVMYATLRSGCASGSSGLAADDIDGLRFIYPPTASGGNPPQPPTAITNAVVLNTVTLSWTPAATGGPAQSYIVEASLSSGGPAIASLATADASTTMVVGGVQTGVYYVRVRARNALGTSALSTAQTVVTVGPCTAPGLPTGLAYTTADNLVTLTWTPPATGTTQGYWLYAGLGPGLSNALVTALGPTPTFSGPAAFGTYYVRIAARNSCGVGPATADLVVNVQPCTAAPAAPAGLTHSRSGSVVTLNWDNPAAGNLPSRFVIHAGSTPGSSNLLVLPTGNNLRSFTASAGRGTYYVRVVGENNCGQSVASNEITVIVP